jgi:protein SCO1/2
MTRSLVLALALALSVATLGCDAQDESAQHDPRAAHVHRDLPGGELAPLSLYQLEGDWTDANGAAVTLATLRGSAVFLLLFYGTCDYACPLLVHDLQKVAGLLNPAAREQVRFALVTFDPERDSAEQLAAYARTQGLESPRWLLLRGTSDQVRELAATVVVRYRPTGTGQYSHTMRIVLLDHDGVPAGHWDGLERPLKPIAAAAAALVAKR